MEELTGFYNQTRVDYLVPMPMSVEVMAEYVHDFDVVMEHSFVAKDEGGQTLGLGMLGLRDAAAWITRLGVIPNIRRRGAGAALLDGMLDTAEQLGCRQVYLEVIKDNLPARRLFEKRAFKPTEEYVVLRRAPIPPTEQPDGKVSWMYRKDALAKLKTYPHHITWVNDIPSMRNASIFQGLFIELPEGSQGWLLFRHKKFSITHLVLHTEQGNPVAVARNLLVYLHQLYRRMDTYAENILVDDPHLPALEDLGYFEAFRRIEMVRQCPKNHE